MASGSSESKLDRFGDTQRAIRAAKDKPIRYGFIDLPAGISGIAVLTACEIKESDEGVVYFSADGTIESPRVHNDVPIYGLSTHISVFFDDKNFVERMERFTEEVRKLGGDGFWDENPGISPEKACELLLKVRPPIRFRFSTSMGKEQIDPATKKPKINPRTQKPFEPRVFQNWHGTKGVGPAPADNFFDDKSAAKSNGTPPTRGKAAPPTPTPTPAGESVEELLEKAKAMDSGAEERLRELCAEKGVSDEQFDKMDWKKIEKTLLGAGGGAAKAPAARIPSVGDPVKYAPPHPRTGNPTRDRDCEVLTVNARGKTVSLALAGTTDEEYADVPWDKLKYPED